MSNRLLSGDALSKSLAESFNSCNRVIIISAYVTKPAIDWVESVIEGCEISITLVARISAADIMMKSTNLSALKKALELGWEVKRLPDLHAKITLVDESDLFVGSANFTNNGLLLVGAGNIEATIHLVPSEREISFIRGVVSSATPITFCSIKSMEKYVTHLGKKQCSTIEWPEDIFGSVEGMQVNDFPLVPLGSKHDLYLSCPYLIFSKIERAESEESQKRLFLNSKSYKWLVNVLDECEDRCAQYGYIVARLHESLIDDPAPYRRDVKILLSNLMEYIRKYANEYVNISRPNYSQRLCLVNDNG